MNEIPSRISGCSKWHTRGREKRCTSRVRDLVRFQWKSGTYTWSARQLSRSCRSSALRKPCRRAGRRGVRQTSPSWTMGGCASCRCRTHLKLTGQGSLTALGPGGHALVSPGFGRFRGRRAESTGQILGRRRPPSTFRSRSRPILDVCTAGIPAPRNNRPTRLTSFAGCLGGGERARTDAPQCRRSRTPGRAATPHIGAGIGAAQRVGA